ncbi:TPA: hypothetical protein JA361_07230 [Legionella pneumophila]|nr:hypothetical protein [Legionella pneumophila]HAT8182045.1 hypothetical protein [Legionella pneumophila]
MPKLSEMNSVTVWFEPGVGSGHINATIARMNELCLLGFRGFFNIIYLSNMKLSGPKEQMELIARGESCTDEYSLSYGQVLSSGEYTPPEIIERCLLEKFPHRIKNFLLNDDEKFSIPPGTQDELCISGAADQTSEAPVNPNEVSLLRVQMDMAFGCGVMIQLQPPRWLAGVSYVCSSGGIRETIPSLPHKIEDEIKQGFRSIGAIGGRPNAVKIGCYGIRNITSPSVISTLVTLSQAKERCEIVEIGSDHSVADSTKKGILGKTDLGKFYAEIDLMICEGQNTASECLALGVPVLHLPKSYAGNIYPSDGELRDLGFNMPEHKKVYDSVHNMIALTQDFTTGSGDLSGSLQKIRELVDRDALTQLADKINARPSVLEDILTRLGIQVAIKAAAPEVVQQVDMNPTKQVKEALGAAKKLDSNFQEAAFKTRLP